MATQNSATGAAAAAVDDSYTTMPSIYTHDGITVDFTSDDFSVLPERFKQEEKFEKEKSDLVVSKMKG